MAGDTKRRILETAPELLAQTERKAFPPFCHKCRCESIIRVRHFVLETKQPDAKTQC